MPQIKFSTNFGHARRHQNLFIIHRFVQFPQLFVFVLRQALVASPSRFPLPFKKRQRINKLKKKKIVTQTMHYLSNQRRQYGNLRFRCVAVNRLVRSFKQRSVTPFFLVLHSFYIFSVF